MSRAVRAEWTKLRTTPGPWWLLAATVVLTVALGAAAPAATGCAGDAFVGVRLGQFPVAGLGVLVAGGEYGTGLIRTTLAALPNRPVVAAAKALVVAAAVAAAAVVAVLLAPPASLVLARAVPPRAGALTCAAGPGPLLLDGPTLRSAAGSVAYLVLVALLSLGLAAVVRDAAAAVGVVLGLLLLPPLLTRFVTDARLHRLLEESAPGAGPGVLAAWAAAALLAGTLLLRARDT